LAEEVLVLFVHLLSERSMIGETPAASARRQLVHRLAMTDASTHSEICVSVSRRLLEDASFLPTLHEVADYVEPRGMAEGKYTLKKEAWRAYDPLYMLSGSQELARAHERAARLAPPDAPPEQPVPPCGALSSLPKEACSAALHGLAYVVIAAAAAGSGRVSERMVTAALRLVAMALWWGAEWEGAGGGAGEAEGEVGSGVGAGYGGGAGDVGGGWSAKGLGDSGASAGSTSHGSRGEADWPGSSKGADQGQQNEGRAQGCRGEAGLCGEARAAGLMMPSRTCILTNALRSPRPLPTSSAAPASPVPPAPPLPPVPALAPLPPMLDLLCQLIRDERYTGDGYIGVRSGALHVVRMLGAASPEAQQRIEALLPAGGGGSDRAAAETSKRSEVLRRKRQARERQAAILRRFAMRQAAFGGADEEEAPGEEVPPSQLADAARPPSPVAGPLLSPSGPGCMPGAPSAPACPDAADPPRTCALCHDEMRPGEAVGLLALAQRASTLLPRHPPRHPPLWCEPCEPDQILPGGADPGQAGQDAEPLGLNGARGRENARPAHPTPAADPQVERGGWGEAGAGAEGGAGAWAGEGAAEVGLGGAAEEGVGGAAAPPDEPTGRETQTFVRTDDLMGDHAEGVLQAVMRLMQQQQEADRRIEDAIQPAPQGLEDRPLSSPQGAGATSPAAAASILAWLSSPAGAYGLHIRSCGHEAHDECLRRYLGSLRIEGSRLDETEWTCPVCRRICNMLIPIEAGGHDSAMQAPATALEDMQTSTHRATHPSAFGREAPQQSATARLAHPSAEPASSGAHGLGAGKPNAEHPEAEELSARNIGAGQPQAEMFGEGQLGATDPAERPPPGLLGWLASSAWSPDVAHIASPGPPDPMDVSEDGSLDASMDVSMDMSQDASQDASLDVSWTAYARPRAPHPSGLGPAVPPTAASPRPSQLAAFGSGLLKLTDSESRRLLRPLPRPTLDRFTSLALLTASIASTVAVLATGPPPGAHAAAPTLLGKPKPHPTPPVQARDILAAIEPLLYPSPAQRECLTQIISCARAMAEALPGHALRCHVTCLLRGGALPSHPPTAHTPGGDGSSNGTHPARHLLSLDPFSTFTAALLLWPSSRWRDAIERSRLLHMAVGVAATQALLGDAVVRARAGLPPSQPPDARLHGLGASIQQAARELLAQSSTTGVGAGAGAGSEAWAGAGTCAGPELESDPSASAARGEAGFASTTGSGVCPPSDAPWQPHLPSSVPGDEPSPSWDALLRLSLSPLLRRLLVLTQPARLFPPSQQPAAVYDALCASAQAAPETEEGDAHSRDPAAAYAAAPDTEGGGALPALCSPDGSPASPAAASSEMDVLCRLLGLPPPLEVLASVADDMTAALRLTHRAHTLAEPAAAATSPATRHGTSRLALALRPSLDPSRSLRPSPFIPLPHSYSELYNSFLRRKCQSCGSIPLQPASCLLCGTLVCAGGACCREGGDDEAVRHAAACGNGVGAFIVVRLSTTLLIMGRRCATQRHTPQHT
jgi:hypothetical protein